MIPDNEWVETDAEDLDWRELAAALQATAADGSWGYQAAVFLIVEQRNWLHHPEFLQAVEAGWNRHGRVFAWVNWAEVDMTAPASSGELRLMEIARSLAGIPNTQPLRDLLVSFDDNNLARVLRAIQIAARGLL